MSADFSNEHVGDYFSREQKKLVNYVHRLIQDTAEMDAEDIVQDVMLNLFDSADVTAPIENLSAYVYRSIYNRVVDRYRKKKYAVLSIDDEKEDGKSLSGILTDMRYESHTELHKKELRLQIFKAVGDLNPQLKAVFISTEFEGRSFRELSVEWNVSINTLLSRKHRAIKKIKSALKKYYIGLKE
jgi:RNA polymerase sigma factor (sigma-70 family)